MVKKIIIFLLFLVSVDFFRLTYIPEKITFVLGLSFGIMIALSSILIFLYQRFDRIQQNFTYEIIIFLFAINLGIVGALIFHDQNPGLTFWIQRYSLFFFTYFFLHALRFKIKDLEQIIFILGMIYIIFFLVQFILYPRILFDVRISPARGTIRIFFGFLYDLTLLHINPKTTLWHSGTFIFHHPYPSRNQAKYFIIWICNHRFYSNK